MAELTNTTVHTNFKEVKGDVEITGNAVVNKEDVITSIDGEVKYKGERVCGCKAYSGADGKLSYNLHGVQFPHLCEVLSTLEGVEASVLASLIAAKGE